MLKLVQFSSNDYSFPLNISLEKDKMFTNLCIEISGNSEGSSVNNFHVFLTTIEALSVRRMTANKKEKYLVVPDFSVDNIESEIMKVVSLCSCEIWEDSCEKLSKYFYWEYGSYK